MRSSRQGCRCGWWKVFDPPLGGKKAIYMGVCGVREEFGMAGAVAGETRVGWVKAGKPAGWEEEVDGVKQACWCGEMWDDHHEDGNHEDVWVEAAAGVKKAKNSGMKVVGVKKAKKGKKAKTAKAAKSGRCGV